MKKSKNGARSICRKAPKRKKPRKSTRQITIERLDKEFSLYIRTKYQKDNGLIDCATCDTSQPLKLMQAGHFMSRRYMPTRYHEKNVLPQCRACNMFAQGRQWLFGRKLDEMFGRGTAKRMYELSRSGKTVTEAELNQLLHEYRERNRALGKGD